MCGILFTSDAGIAKEDFLRALETMRHRGPDVVGGYAFCHGSQLGHNRLKIVDLDDRSNQPFYSHSGKYVIIYNGEVYNYRELAAAHGIERRTSGDTEVVIELYEEMGPSMLSELNGMFAFVIMNTANGEVFAARDRLGVKPLYYCSENGGFIIASEIAAVLELTGDRDFDSVGLRQYRKLRTFFNGHTAYSGISMFPPGHYMLAGTVHRYWQLPEVKQEPPDEDELRELIESAVTIRCIADVPIGSYLSGGLDSTIVAGLALKPHTWTIGFADNNEFLWARQAARKFDSIHEEVVIDAEEFVSLARQMIKTRREPLSVPNEVLLYKMTQKVKEENTVVLSGEGADELFFGYDRIFRWAAANPWNLEEFSKLYAYGSHDDPEIVEDAVSLYLHLGSAIDIVAAFFQNAHLHGLLRRLDNSTMLASVEARVPFVDYRLIERMAGVSFDYRMAGGVVKTPLKKAFQHLVPQTIIERDKIGFPVDIGAMPLGEGISGKTPMDRWLNFNLKELTGTCSPEELL